MRVSPIAPSPSPVPPSVGGSVEDVLRQAAILADGSSASDEQKIDAYVAIRKAFASPAASDWFQSSTQAGRDAVNAALNGAMGKQIQQAADAFSARGMSAPREGNVMAGQIDALSRMSMTQQKMIFAGTASLDQTGTLESWKSFLQTQADGRDQQLAAERAEKTAKADKASAVQVSLSDDAKAALDALTNEDGPGGVTEAALSMLRKAAEDRAETRSRKDDSEDLGVRIDRTA